MSTLERGVHEDLDPPRPNKTGVFLVSCERELVVRKGKGKPHALAW